MKRNQKENNTLDTKRIPQKNSLCCYRVELPRRVAHTGNQPTPCATTLLLNKVEIKKGKRWGTLQFPAATSAGKRGGGEDTFHRVYFGLLLNAGNTSWGRGGSNPHTLLHPQTCLIAESGDRKSNRRPSGLQMQCALTITASHAGTCAHCTRCVLLKTGFQLECFIRKKATLNQGSKIRA